MWNLPFHSTMKTIDKIFYEEKYIAEIENKGRKFVSAKNEVRTLSVRDLNPND